jgi:hypothetical protein
MSDYWIRQAISRMREGGDAEGAACAERELAEARRDAERYRWLRDKATTGDWQEIGGVTAETMEQAVDAAIDAAMQEGER